MAGNLKVTRYRNGDLIPRVTGGGAWDTLFMGAYCDYDNDTANIAVYGRLYNWFAVVDSRNLAPEGWHVPSDAEWMQLEMYLGMSEITADSLSARGTDEGGKIKEADTIHWMSPNTGATNESGFTALPGGGRDGDAGFLAMYECAFFWSSTEYNSDRAFYRALWFDESYIAREIYDKVSGFSV